MPIDVSLGPGRTFARLMGKLNARHAHFENLDAYYRGVNLLPLDASRQQREAEARHRRMCRTNFAELVVQAVVERMVPTGFRAGAGGTRADDDEAWGIWQANHLDADCGLIFTPQLAMGASFVIVGAVDDEIGAPRITPEDPRQVVCEFRPGSFRRVTAALKVFRDESAGEDRAYLYLPGNVAVAVRPVKQSTVKEGLRLDTNGWEWAGSQAQKLPSLLANRVPVVPFLNRPDTFGAPTGEFEPHLSLLDRIDHTILRRMEITNAQAFRSRAVTGLPREDENGNEIDYDGVFSLDPGSLWQLPEGADMWESGQADLNPIRQAIRDDVQDFAAVTRTPLHYLTPEAANGSAEGASLSREGLEFKVEDRIPQASESLEAVIALAFAFLGDEGKATRRDMEVIWRPPQRRSLAEKADAATKAKASGMSVRWIMENVWQMSPQEIAREESAQQSEALLAMLQQPEAAEPEVEGVPVGVDV